MHDNHIIHADLKPENLMHSSRDPDKAELKLVDFGCPVLVDRGKNVSQPGTAAYSNTTAHRPATSSMLGPSGISSTSSTRWSNR